MKKNIEEFKANARELGKAGNKQAALGVVQQLKAEMARLKEFY